MSVKSWVKFYHLRWSTDSFVDSLTAERKGVYFTLLVRQMVEGYVCLDHPELLIRHFPGVSSPEEVSKLIDEGIRSKFVLKDPQDPNKPTQWVNKKLVEIVEESSYRDKKFASFGSPAFSFKTDPLECKFPVREFIEKEFPRRKSSSNRWDPKGWDEGIELIQDSIMDEETWDAFMVAVRSYKNSQVGKDPRYTVQLINFAKQWTIHLPPNYVRKSEQPRTPVEAALQQVVQPEPRGESVKEGPRAGQTVPWALTRYSNDRDRKAASRWTEDRRARWLAGEDVSKEIMGDLNIKETK